MMSTQEEANNFFKQKRDEYLIEIRKKKNVNMIEAKRMKFSVEYDQNDSQNNQALNNYLSSPLEDLCSAFVNLYKSENLNELPLLAKAIRLLVSRSDVPPVGIIMNANIIPYFLNILKSPNYFDVALIQEISWICINLVSNDPEYTNYMVGVDIIPISMQLLDFGDDDIKENAIWILANITGDSLVYRNDLFKRGIAPKIEELFNDKSIRPTIWESLIWLISNLCRGRPNPDFHEVASFLVYIQDYIKNCDKESVLVNCMYSLSYLTDTDDEVQIEEILDMDILEELVPLLKSKNPRMRKAIVRTIGNITSSSDENTEAIIKCNFIEAMYPLLNDEYPRIRKDACWCYSNILAGVTSQAKQVFKFEDGKIIEKLFKMAREDEADVSEECIFALTNSAQSVGMTEIGFLVDLGFIEMIIELLSKVKREDILVDCLGALTSILEEGKQISFGPTPAENPYFNQLLEYDGVRVLEKLQNFPGEAVYKKLEKILKDFVDKM